MKILKKIKLKKTENQEIQEIKKNVTFKKLKKF